jgi:hypothetical protein
MDAFSFITYVPGMISIVWLLTLINKKSSTISESSTAFTPTALESALIVTQGMFKPYESHGTAMTCEGKDNKCPDRCSAVLVLVISDVIFDL